jgi:hypothetical protein
LARLARDEIQHHPDRAKLALLAAAGRSQLGDSVGARHFLRLAKDWGCNPRLLGQIMVAGVHNSVARAAVATGQAQRALGHFESAIRIGTPGGEVSLLHRARALEQVRQLRGRSAVDITSPFKALEQRAEGCPPPRLDWRSASTVRTLHHFSCTGGTLIAKCLAAQPNVVVFNEVDPRSKMGLSQTETSAFTPRDIISLLHQSASGSDERLIDEVFLADLQLIGREYAMGSRKLLLRDHSHSAYLTGAEPRDGPSLRAILCRRFLVRSVVTVRNPIDSYLSLLHNGWVHFKPATFEEYCCRYMRFLDDHADVPVLRYEDFVEAPQRVMQRMCHALDLPFCDDFPTVFARFKFSGDSGRSGDVIEPRTRREYSTEFRHEVLSSATFAALARRLGYPSELAEPAAVAASATAA